jgi:hypothetical protein
MKIFLQVIGLLIIQNILEVLVMAVLAKLGVPYMDFNAGGESIFEMIGGIAYYYSFSKFVIILLPYIFLMLIASRYLLKNLSWLNLITSLLLTIIFWIYFNNPVKEIINPVLGTMISGFFILFIKSIVKKKNIEKYFE